ncbi:PCRF domain-containing protein [Patescibacteria group bacterium]|nr:PCRF domain-containing protein [Patescibacteria group bacterium]
MALDLAKLKEEYDTLTEELANPELISDWERFQQLSKRRKELEKVVEKAQEIEDVKAKIEENSQLAAADEGPELSSLAEQELTTLREQEGTLSKELKELLTGGHGKPAAAVLIEIRPGTGGVEAALFAANLWNMYRKYGEKQGWKQTTLHLAETELGGIKEVVFEMEGKDVARKLQYEGGVHRVQRTPETEKQGRIHTSTASVAVLPKPTKEETRLAPSDLKIEFTTSSGPGGQNVNKRQTAVRLTHLPTGITVTAETSRTQQANKEAALSLLQAKIAQLQRKEQTDAIAGQRKAQIGGAERAEKIRTYNFPQDRVTDHRIKKSWGGIEKIVSEGQLDPVTEALQQELR